MKLKEILKEHLNHYFKTLLLIVSLILLFKASSNLFKLLQTDNFYIIYYPKISSILGVFFSIVFIIGFIISLIYLR